jgi:hypothetical protein
VYFRSVWRLFVCWKPLQGNTTDAFSIVTSCFIWEHSFKAKDRKVSLLPDCASISKIFQIRLLIINLNYVVLVYPSMSFQFFFRFGLSFGVWPIIKVGFTITTEFIYALELLAPCMWLTWSVVCSYQHHEGRWVYEPLQFLEGVVSSVQASFILAVFTLMFTVYHLVCRHFSSLYLIWDDLSLFR